MRSSPRKLSTETDLYTAAINSLARRAYSVYEMRTIWSAARKTRKW